MVKFTGGTFIGDHNKHEIPPKLHALTNFSDIIIDRFNKDVLIGNKHLFMFSYIFA